MKGQAEVTEILTWIGIIVVLVALIPVIMPIIRDAIESFAFSSPEVVSKDLASLISITVASSSNITIDYEIPLGVNYDVDIDERKVTVSKNGEEEEASSPILIDLKGSFSDIDEFTIKKTIEENQEKYYVNDELLLSITRT